MLVKFSFLCYHELWWIKNKERLYFHIIKLSPIIYSQTGTVLNSVTLHAVDLSVGLFVRPESVFMPGRVGPNYTSSKCHVCIISGCNAIVLTKFYWRRATGIQTPGKMQPLMWWSTLQDISPEPLIGFWHTHTHTQTDTQRQTRWKAVPAFAIADDRSKRKSMTNGSLQI